MWNRLCRIACLLPTGGWTLLTAAAILWITLTPDPLPDDDFTLWEHADKIVHFLMFFGMFLSACFDLTRRSLRSTGKIPPFTIRINLCCWTMLFGAIIEIVQPYFERGCDGADFLADSTGAIIALLISGWLMKKLFRA